MYLLIASVLIIAVLIIAVLIIAVLIIAVLIIVVLIIAVLIIARTALREETPECLIYSRVCAFHGKIFSIRDQA